MAALLVRRRLKLPAEERVEDCAQLEQIAHSAERDAVDIVVVLRGIGAGCTPVGPRGRNERAAAIRQDDEHKHHAASLDAADHGQRLAFEGVPPADDRHLIGNILEMGSLSCLPSTTSIGS